MIHSRRDFFRALLVGAGLQRRASPSGADVRKRNMIVRSRRPEDLEMPLDGFLSWITPIDRFFVRSHVYTPQVDISNWRLRIDGQVSSPLTLNLEELKKFPRAELVSVLECAGNGRSFYQPPVAGTQWQYGAVGNARWAGVRLADVLKQAGVKPSAKHVLCDGADVPIGAMPDFIRTVPVHKCLHPETLLAFEMNGQSLPLQHGYPLRLVVPGWAGDSWVKWLKHLEVLDKEYTGFFMKAAYRHPVRPIAPGTSIEGIETAPIEALGPKSVIASPVTGAALDSGSRKIQGAAWSGEASVAKVEVSTDNGRSWQAAKLGSDQAKYAWRLWELAWTPAGPGSYVLMARASDASGAAQPFAEEWNPSGYLWNVVQQVRVSVGEKPSPQLALNPAPPQLPPEVKTACIGCHEEGVIRAQRLTRAQWEREVAKMTAWGAPVKASDRDSIIDFLARAFPVK